MSAKTWIALAVAGVATVASAALVLLPSTADAAPGQPGSASTGHYWPGGLGQGNGIGGHKTRLQNATSTNWAGWVDTGGNYTSVSGSWRQPTITCAVRETSYSSFWVGLDGDGSGTVEQTGTEADCVNGTPTYSSWYEFFPAYPVYYSNRVKPGDSLSASVTYSASTNRYTTTLTDSTQRWTHTTTGAVTGAKNFSAEVIAEAPSNGSTGQVLTLANFGSVSFSAATVNGVAIGSEATPSSLNMVTSSGAAKATTSTLRGGTAFSVSWVSSGAATRRQPPFPF